MPDVIADGEVADLDCAADLFISQSLCDHFQNFKFAPAKTRLKFALGNSVVDPLREVALTRMYGMHCLYDLGAGDVLAEITLGSRLNCPANFFIGLKAGQDDHVGRTREFL